MANCANIPLRIEEGGLDRYLEAIRYLDALTQEEERALGHRIRTGDEEAKTRLVQANLRYVVTIAKEYQHHGMPLSDLINEGNVGLMRAADRFDPSQGFRFIPYAVWWIRQAMLGALTDIRGHT